MIDIDKLRALLAAHGAALAVYSHRDVMSRGVLADARAELGEAAFEALPQLLDEVARWRAIGDAADELDRASVVLGASVNENSKRRFFDAIGNLCDAVDAARKAGT